MTDERYVCLDGTPARMTPQAVTGDAVDAMVEKLWDVWNTHMPDARQKSWQAQCAMVDEVGNPRLREVRAFRAMARVALVRACE